MNAYDRAVLSLRDRRREALDRAHIAWQTAIHNDDDLYAVFREYQEQMILAAQKKENTLYTARQKMKEAVTRAGFDKKDFDPPCECAECKDTGKIDGRYCKCVVKRVIASDRENLSILPIDFDSAEKTAPSPAIKKAYANARDYLADTSKSFLILLGEPGRGKTMLAAAILSAAMAKGASAVAVTASELVRRARDYHTQFSIPDYIDRFTPMLDCDLLVIDDLGTESIMKNVTTEYLYTVINERLIQSKRTVITTNLSALKLNERYGTSIFSRMCDKSRAIVLSVDGKNSRLK